MPESSNDNYSAITGYIFVFNLIVGTGALTIPGTFSKAGWCLGTILISLLGVISYITVTFVIETLSSVNIIEQAKLKGSINCTQSEESNNDEDTPLFTSAQDEAPNEGGIVQKYEIGEMATILLSKPLRVILYLCLTVYLFGDLAIYCAAVATTLSHTTCTFRPSDLNCSMKIPENTTCWANTNLTRSNMYQIYIVLFLTLLGPFVFFNVQKTKLLQMFTTGVRWLAFFVMIAWSMQKLVNEGQKGHPPVANMNMVPGLFGSCVYSFMCHHSLPGLIHPIQNKSKLKNLFRIDYVLIAFFYILLSVTGSLTFSHVEDLYTLNFWPNECTTQNPSITIVLDYFLALFPVFTLSTSFPIIAITLRNNLKYIFLNPGSSYNLFVEKILFPLLTIIPPTVLALSVSDLQVLVGAIGSYAGTAVQYLIPCMLVSAARTQVPLNSSILKSPFQGREWVYGIYIWTIISLILISLNYINNYLNV